MENQNEIKGLVFLKSYYESIQELENDDKLEMYNAIFELAFLNQSPTFSKKYLGAIFKVMEPNIQNSLDRYKASKENGKKGGRPAKSTGIKASDIPQSSIATAPSTVAKVPTAKVPTAKEVINEDNILSLPIPEDSMFYVAPKIAVDEFDVNDHIKPAQYDIMIDSIKSLDKIMKMCKVTEVTEVILHQIAEHFEFPIKLGDDQLLQFINEAVEDQYQIN